jgi:hypothetical protein
MESYMAGLAEFEELLDRERAAIEAADLDELLVISRRKEEIIRAMSGMVGDLIGEERALARSVLDRLWTLQEQNRLSMTTSVDRLVAEMGVIRTGRRVLQSYSPANVRPEAVYLDSRT